MNRTKTWIVSAALPPLMILAACGRGDTPDPGPTVARPVKVFTVGSGESGLVEVSYPGRVAATNQVDLSFRVGGPLIEFPALEGRSVQRGELLARVDPRDFQLRINASQADFDRTAADLVRFSALYEKDAVSKAQLDQSQAARDVAKAALDDARAALGDTYLKASFAGRIGETFVENFQEVTPGQKILSLIDASSVDIVVDAPEARVAHIREDPSEMPRIVARFDTARGREFDLSLKEIAAQADPRTQTYRITLTMKQPAGVNILPGMTANVVAYTPVDQASHVLIPAIAVFADESGVSYVWIVDDEKSHVTRRQVTTGSLSGTESIEIVAGLAAGESIATTGVTRLTEGMPIRPLDELEGFNR